MAIFGIGAHYGYDGSDEFLARECACVGWSEDEAPPAHGLLRHLRTGDVVFIKSFSPKAGLTIKAVGIVTDGRVGDFGKLGKDVPVRWVWSGKESVGKIDDKWPVRSVTIYEEFHPRVHSKVLGLLLGRE